MKCPKCHYLGFETGDRCKNCGYDFSLMTDSGPDPVDIDLDLREAAPTGTADWLARVDATLSEAEPERAHAAPPAPPDPPPSAPKRWAPGPTPSADHKLPLFTPALEDGDEPLIKLPPTPRPPLAVRRTPETPRFRAVATPVRRAEPEPTPPLRFEGDEEAQWKEPVRRSVASHAGEASRPGARAAAAVIDHLMLGGIDVAVVYFTVRMAGLPMEQWWALPMVPLVAFLLLIKVSYFYAFTVVGGQTIGKMAARIRVVSTDDVPLDAGLALRRTLAGTVSAMLLGLGFLPALFGSDRRALHDRVARTRVIALPSA